MSNEAVQIILAILGVVGGAGAWNFYQKKIELKHKENTQERGNQNLFRDQILEEMSRVKKELQESNTLVLQLTAEVSTLRERVKNLETENDRLLRG